VAPLSSNVSRTQNGIATFFLLTSRLNVGNYEVVAESEGIFSTPPVIASVSVSCFVPPTATPTAAPAAVAAAPAAAAPAPQTTVRPPNTGDGGLR